MICAGNVAEWTMEACPNKEGDVRIARGRDWQNSKDIVPISYRTGVYNSGIYQRSTYY